MLSVLKQTSNIFFCQKCQKIVQKFNSWQDSSDGIQFRLFQHFLILIFLIEYIIKIKTVANQKNKIKVKLKFGDNWTHKKESLLTFLLLIQVREH